jgi:membrane-associated phospholipid phosphatase
MMARATHRLCACVLLLCVFAGSVRADAPAADGDGAAQAPHRLVWKPEWPYFRPIGYWLTAASVLGAVGSTLFLEYPDDPRWSGGILFDNAARRALRAHDPGARDAIRTASDIALIASITQAGLIDGALLPLIDRSPGVAGQLTLINAQAFAINILFSTLLFKAAARERPLIPDCQRDPKFDPLCNAGPYASFPSSHTSTAFTAAGLICVHHQYLQLYGGAWDTAACIESIAVATATGLFRVIGDRHYMSDVILGGAMGFTIGYVYPWLLHYSGSSDVPRESRAARSDAVHVSVVPTPTGLGVTGVF